MPFITRASRFLSRASQFTTRESNFYSRAASPAFVDRADHGTVFAFPTSAAEINTALGFGEAGIWRAGHNCQESASPLGDFIGTTTLAQTAAGMTYAVAGDPLVSGDLGVEYAAAGGYENRAATAAIIEPGPNAFAMLLHFKLTATAGGSRRMYGVDGASRDWAVGCQVNNRVTFLTNDGTSVRTVTAIADHNDGAWHTALAVMIPNDVAGQRVITDLAASGAASTSGIGDLTDAAQGFYAIGAAGSNAPCIVSFAAIAISDGTPGQNASLADLMTNQATALANFRATIGH